MSFCGKYGLFRDPQVCRDPYVGNRSSRLQGKKRRTDKDMRINLTKNNNNEK